MLAVDQRARAVRRLAGGQQQRIAGLTHERIGAQHGLEAQRALAERALSHAHHHAADEGLVAAARPALAIVDAIEQGMAHQHPVAVGMDHDPIVRRGVGLPAGARGVALHAIGAERAGHETHQVDSAVERLARIARVNGQGRSRSIVHGVVVMRLSKRRRNEAEARGKGGAGQQARAESLGGHRDRPF